MKIGKTFGFTQITGLLTLLIISSCGTGSKTADPFLAAKFDPFDVNVGSRIAAYNDIVAQNIVHQKKGNPALYIDFSSGINKAFNEPAIKGMMTDCFNTILASKFDVYKLGSNQVMPMNVTNSTELGQQVGDPKQYLDIWAPIQSAVDKIVDGNNDALLITDFEEWQSNIEVTSTAFLKIPFSKWLKKGNTIHFFIADYNEGTVAKHLYFTVFSQGKPDASSLISKLSPKLSPATVQFELSDHAYHLRTDYPAVKSGGIFYDVNAKSETARNVLDLRGSYLNGLKDGHPFEFYPLGLDWKTISELHTSYASQNQFNDFFRKLFVDLSNQDSYLFGNFDVKVADVTTDFENFAKYDEAKKHQPKLAKGNNGEAKLADNQDDPIALGCFNADGKLKDEWIYTLQQPTSYNEVFTLNKALFENTKATTLKDVELGVLFHPKFDLKNILNPDGLMKVDLVMANAEANLSNAKLAKFQWVNAKNKPNIALCESIKNTLTELTPTGKTIYSYYIKAKSN